MEADLPVYIGPDAYSRLVAYCQGLGLEHFMLVSDRNTYAAAGWTVADALGRAGLDVKTITLAGSEIIADERYVFQVLLHSEPGQRVYLAVGSGTITDITRFVSHRTGNSFISVPTAPSVDGFASPIAPLVIGGYKQSVPAQLPIAVFADVETLRAAPHPMIAAGFGDMLGKYIALADWLLGRLLWDEPYNEEIAGQTRAALERCVENAAEIGQATNEGMRKLLSGLITSGLSMRDFGSSLPASGAEHLLSHFWEMRRLQERQPALLHGAKVGVATVLMARYYAALRTLDAEQARQRLEATEQPNRTQEMARMGAVYGPTADEVIAGQSRFLDMPAEGYQALQRKIQRQWDRIREIAATVPPADDLAGMLRQAGGPVTPAELGLTAADVTAALANAHYLRGRLTVDKLARMLGLTFDEKEQVVWIGA